MTALGTNIRKFREKQGLTQAELASRIGMSQQSIDRYENAGTMPREKVIQAMINLFGISRDELFGDKPAGTGVKTVPVLGTVVAGQPAYAAENIIGWEEVTERMAKQGKLFALKVRGDSMLPEFKEGDTIIVKEQSDVESGEIAVVLINGDEATLKKVKKTKDGIMLYAFNPTVYEPHFYSNSEIESLPVRIIGKVVENRREW